MIKYQSGYKYQLYEDYVHKFPKNFPKIPGFNDKFISSSGMGSIRIMRGYAWDGPSGPTVDTKDFMRGSLVHDALYQCMREGYLYKTEQMKDAADDELRRICRQDGMSAIRAWYVYQAVKRFGASSILNDKKVETAP